MVETYVYTVPGMSCANCERAVKGELAEVAGVESDVLSRVADQRAQLEQVKGELEQRVRDLTPRLPGGIRLPGE